MPILMQCTSHTAGGLCTRHCTGKVKPTARTVKHKGNTQLLLPSSLQQHPTLTQYPATQCLQCSLRVIGRTTLWYNIHTLHVHTREALQKGIRHTTKGMQTLPQKNRPKSEQNCCKESPLQRGPRNPRTIFELHTPCLCIEGCEEQKPDDEPLIAAYAPHAHIRPTRLQGFIQATALPSLPQLRPLLPCCLDVCRMHHHPLSSCSCRKQRQAWSAARSSSSSNCRPHQGAMKSSP